jgi:hypothetical protein
MMSPRRDARGHPFAHDVDEVLGGAVGPALLHVEGADVLVQQVDALPELARMAGAAAPFEVGFQRLFRAHQVGAAFLGRQRARTSDVGKPELAQLPIGLVLSLHPSPDAPASGRGFSCRHLIVPLPRRGHGPAYFFPSTSSRNLRSASPTLCFGSLVRPVARSLMEVCGSSSRRATSLPPTPALSNSLNSFCQRVMARTIALDRAECQREFGIARQPGFR